MNNQLSHKSEELKKENTQLDKMNDFTNTEKELSSMIDTEKGKTNIENSNILLDNITDKETGINKNEVMTLVKEKLSNVLLKLDEASLKLNEVINSGKDNFFSNWSSFYDYLDSLSLLEESAFFHILVLSVILVIIFNIYSALFGNEIIKFFKLEERYPKLNIFFKLRIKFQRYYLIWNLILLISICIIAISLDILVLV